MSKNPISPIEPWGTSVNGEDLLHEIEVKLSKHIALSDEEILIVGLWCLFAYTHNDHKNSPILFLTSPVPASGKTTALSLIQRMIPDAYRTSDVSPSTLYRITKKYDSPTLLLDEADMQVKDSPTVVRILNASFTKGDVVFRNETDGKGGYTTTSFSAWYPKVIAGIGALPRALESRTLKIMMLPKGPDKNLSPLPEEPDEEAIQIQRQAKRWSADNSQSLRVANPVIPITMQNRQQDSCRPLLAIADLIGGDYPERARLALSDVLSHAQSKDNPLRLLADCREAFHAQGIRGRISTDTLLRFLHAKEESPWGDMNDGEGLSAHQLSSRLSPFGIGPKKIRIREYKEATRGYELTQFKEIFERCLSNFSLAAEHLEHPEQHQSDVPDVPDVPASKDRGEHEIR